MSTAEGRLALAVDEVAQALGVGRATVWRRIREGDIPARKLAGRTVVLVDDLRAYLRGLPIWQPEDD